MKNKIFLIASFLITGSLLVTSCYYDNEAELYPGACDVSVTNYQDVILPIIENKCYGCHSAAAAEGDVVLEGYDALAVYVDDGSFSCSINWGADCSQMPKNSSQLPSCELAVINLWLENGALNN